MKKVVRKLDASSSSSYNRFKPIEPTPSSRNNKMTSSPGSRLSDSSRLVIYRGVFCAQVDCGVSDSSGKIAINVLRYYCSRLTRLVVCCRVNGTVAPSTTTTTTTTTTSYRSQQPPPANQTSSKPLSTDPKKRPLK